MTKHPITQVSEHDAIHVCTVVTRPKQTFVIFDDKSILMIAFAKTKKAQKKESKQRN